MRSLAIVITIVQSFFLSLFSLRLLLLTHFGESPVCENLFPQVIFIFLRKKEDFLAFFPTFYGQRSVIAALATRSPWSIMNIFYHY